MANPHPKPEIAASIATHTRPQSTSTVRAVVIDLLRSLGMTTIFGNPGSTELPLFRDFPNDFRYVLGLQESIVVGMADGFAQGMRNAALINLHSAAGVGHAMGNIFTAYKNRTPLVITAGQQARSILPYEPFCSPRSRPSCRGPYVKWAVEPARGQDVPAAIARAYYLAMQPPCGPTFVSIPVDDWDQPAEPMAARTVSRSLRPDPVLLGQLGDALDRCARPAFVVGNGADRDGAWDEVVALAERHQALVWVAPMSARCSFPERHPLFAGFLPAIREKIVSLLGGHDLIVALGAPVFTYHIEGFGPHVPDGAQLFQMIDDLIWRRGRRWGTSIVCRRASGRRGSVDAPGAATEIGAARAGDAGARDAGSAHFGLVSHADTRGRAAGGQHRRGRVALQPRDDARSPADRSCGELFHLRQRRARSQLACRRGRGAGQGPASARHRPVRRRIEHVFDPGAVDGGRAQVADDVRDREQRQLCSAQRVRAALQDHEAGRNAVARHRFRRARARARL